MLTQKAKERGDWFDLEREVEGYVDWVEKWRSPSRVEKKAFEFPFDPNYRISLSLTLAVMVTYGFIVPGQPVIMGPLEKP